jgi:hypothetical protein
MTEPIVLTDLITDLPIPADLTAGGPHTSSPACTSAALPGTRREGWIRES